MFLKLHEIKLDEGSNKGRIQVLKEGKFDHAYYGIMLFDEETFDTMIKNFNDKVRGIDIQVNYSHADYAEAAGWMKGLSHEDGKLYADVEWTDDAADKIRAKKFKYISAEFNMDYKDNETGKRFGATVVGAALTNIPFLKGMDAVLSEMKNASDEEVARYREFLERENVNEKKKDKVMNFSEILEGLKELNDTDKAKLLSELGGVKAEAKNDDAEVKALQDENDKLKAEIKFNEMLAKNQVVPAQREPYINGDLALFAERAVKINLDEKGTEAGAGNEDDKVSGGDDDEKKDDEADADDADEAQEKVAELAEKRFKEMKGDAEPISFSEVISQILDENPKLAEKYEG